MTKINLKEGASLQGIPEFIIKTIQLLTRIALGLGFDLIVTSGTDSLNKHGGGDRTKTLHDDGLAFDLRIKNMNNNQLTIFVSIAKAVLIGYDVVLEHNHIHVEYDYKEVKRCK